MSLRLVSTFTLALAVLLACSGRTGGDDDDGDDDGGSGMSGGTGGSSAGAGNGAQSGGKGGKGGATNGGTSGAGAASATGGTGGTNGGSAGAVGGSSTGGSATSGVGGSTAGTGGSTSGGSGTGGTGGSGGDGGTGGLTIDLCNVLCTAPADCVSATSSSYDEDNYACDDGLCVYTGCNSDDECSTDSPGMVCADSGTGVPVCALPCVTIDDCELDQGAYSADNMACRDGGCFYLGCDNDEECQASFPGYRCHASELGDYSSCMEACTTPADCVADSVLYDDDNYECRDGACVWIGCNSDAECQTLSATYVCR